MRYLNITGEINEMGLEMILDKIMELKYEEKDFIDTLTEDNEFTEEEAIELLGPIQINISSFGGMLDVGFAILDALSVLKSPIHTRANGYCMSTGLLLLVAGDVKECGPYTTFMYHTVAYGYEGHLARHKTQMDSAKELQKRVDDLICKKTNIEGKLLKKYKNDDWHFNAQEALDLGVVDAIR